METFIENRAPNRSRIKFIHKDRALKFIPLASRKQRKFRRVLQLNLLNLHSPRTSKFISSAYLKNAQVPFLNFTPQAADLRYFTNDIICFEARPIRRI